MSPLVPANSRMLWGRFVLHQDLQTDEGLPFALTRPSAPGTGVRLRWMRPTYVPGFGDAGLLLHFLRTCASRGAGEIEGRS